MKSVAGVSESLKRIRGEDTEFTRKNIGLSSKDDDDAINLEGLLSGSSETAARHSILKLASAMSKPETDPSSLAGLVSEMLKPMLQEWFNAHVPEIVDRLVSQEITKLSTALE